MDERPVNVLLIDADRQRARLLGEALDRAAEMPFQLSWAEQLAAGLDRLAGGDIDAALVSLDLPDAAGPQAIARVYAQAPGLPIVALTDRDDAAVASEAIRLGARHSVVHGQIDPAQIARGLLSAIARRRIVSASEQDQQQQRHEHEIVTVERIAGHAPLAVTSQMFGAGPLSESAPAEFAALVERYAGLLDLALEQRQYKIDHNVGQELRALADQMGFLRAGPRDVVDIHSQALRRKTSRASRARAQALLEEGRLTVLELMGHLVSCYRSYAFGMPPPARDTAGSYGGEQID